MPLEQIRRLVKVMGADFVQEVLHETQSVEAAGGLFLERENRRRTPGGVFFHLTCNRMTKPQRGKVVANPTRSEQQPVQPLNLPEALHALTQRDGLSDRGITNGTILPVLAQQVAQAVRGSVPSSVAAQLQPQSAQGPHQR